MNLLEKNIQALLSGVNEPLGNKLLNFIQNKTSLNVLSCATHLSLVHFLDNKSVVLRDDPLY
ncbi:hypothetical protein, partial [Campylobacter coli]|uniref:hypothetical protein n=1 Tax=Campylobacter coli TaxID=195 RepID=UPI000B105B7E